MIFDRTDKALPEAGFCHRSRDRNFDVSGVCSNEPHVVSIIQVANINSTNGLLSLWVDISVYFEETLML